MPIGKVVLFAVIVLLVQIWVTPIFLHWGGNCHFILLWVMFLSCYHDSFIGMLVGVSLGFIEDGLNLECFGLSALGYLLVGYLPRLLGTVFFLENLVSQYIYLVFAHLLIVFLDTTVQQALTHGLPQEGTFLFHRVSSLVFDAIALPILFSFWVKIIGVPVSSKSRTRAKSNQIIRR